MIGVRNVIRIATRRSPLALWQANHVRSLLLAVDSEYDVQLVPMLTQGDQHLDHSLTKIGGKGLFTKELERAILRGEADLAVHSIKDLPARFVPELGIGAILPRADPRDALVADSLGDWRDLPQGARVATSSLRRSTQLLRLRPDLNVCPLRGNVGTRLNKLPQFDAIVLAVAGLERLDLGHRITHAFAVEDLLPACGQGAIAVQVRSDDTRLQAKLAALNCSMTERCVVAERACNLALGGSCHTPVALYAQRLGDALRLRGRVLSVDASVLCEADCTQSISDAPDALGLLVARELEAQGAKAIITATRSDNA